MYSVNGQIREILQEYLKNKEGSPYYGKELNFSSTVQTEIKKFPTLYVKFMGEVSLENDLEHNRQNFIDSNIQLTSYNDKTYNGAFELINHAGDILLKMGYSLVYGPENLTQDSPNICVARFNRMVSNGTVLKNLLER